MSAEDKSNPTARAAALYAGGVVDARPGTGALRGGLRRLLLRILRPYAHHQRVLDGEIIGALQALAEELRRGRERDGERLERLEHLVRELFATAETQRRETAGAAGAAAGAAHTADALADELNSPPYIEGEPFTAFGSPVGEVLGYRSGASPFAAESGYVAFEDLFRGAGERVAESQRAYLSLLRDKQPVLDVGCGRGEMLALLAGEGIAASGVDTDAGMVERCRAAGLDAVHADANAHLESLADGSLGAVFSAQVIEHIPFAGLERLLALALAKLRPGGLFIAETVNPHRISSLKTFWVDPTHQHPLFPEVALALSAIAGFGSAYVFTPGFDSFAQGRLRAPSYAVVATAGEPGTSS